MDNGKQSSGATALKVVVFLVGVILSYLVLFGAVPLLLRPDLVNSPMDPWRVRYVGIMSTVFIALVGLVGWRIFRRSRK